MFKMAVPVIVAPLLALLAALPYSDACGGFNLVIKKAESTCPGGEDSIFKFSDDFGLKMTHDCKIIPTGCAEITKNFNMAEVSYTLTSALGVPIAKGTCDGCKNMEEAEKNPDAVMLMDMFGVPKKCPVTAGKICGEGKEVDISKYKDQLMPGAIKGETIIKHEGGMMSCLRFEGALKK